jgi:NTP pyrophosphatase (non-canonical NTP hydrolase)
LTGPRPDRHNDEYAMSIYSEHVRQFMEAVGQDCDRRLESGPLLDLRLRLIQEEYTELLESLQTCLEQRSPSTTADVFKEMADLLYVLHGFCITFGIPIDAIFERVHQSNLSKLQDGQPRFRADGKLLKSDRYYAPQFDDLAQEYWHQWGFQR